MADCFFILYNIKKYVKSGKIMIEKQINTTFRILSSICILLVVAGHADFHIFDLGGMFPYYSFHVMAFLFISGYFYYEESEKDIISYIKRKMCKLMLPYLAWNFFYGLAQRLWSLWEIMTAIMLPSTTIYGQTPKAMNTSAIWSCADRKQWLLPDKGAHPNEKDRKSVV